MYTVVITSGFSETGGEGGIPGSYLEYLQLLEDQSLARGNQDDLFSRKTEPEPEPAIDPLREELQKVNPDELTPREALELLYRLKKL